MGKLKSIAKILALLLSGVVFISLIEYEKSKHGFLFSTLLVPIFSLLFYIFMIGYFKPTRWLFKFKCLINGLIAGACFTPLILSAATRHHSCDLSNPKSVILQLIVPSVFATVVTCLYFYFHNKRLTKNTPLNMERGEIEIVSGSASFEDEDNYLTKGRLVLTNYRLCFIPTKLEETRMEFRNVPSKLLIDKNSGIPIRIVIPVNGTIIRTFFLFFWKDEIEKVLLK